MGSREVLSQTGAGHFSPVGAYHAEKDMVLVMDVARFKYHPFWVSVPLLWEATQAIDSATGRPRGYMLMWRDDGPRTLHAMPHSINTGAGWHRLCWGEVIRHY